LERYYGVLRKGGALVSVRGVPSPEKAATRGVRAVSFVVRPDGDQLGRIGDLIDAGHIRLTVGMVLPLSEGRRAYERRWGNPMVGKTILQVVDD
jgi:NADPH:quinone reductase-like Zn-dependent oxidoreductase